uniref:Uncharacterized protein n=1 Tax=Romanomermis culicivorax TaxID=13658 RepID=A0A915IXH6_ROMCU
MDQMVLGGAAMNIGGSGNLTGLLDHHLSAGSGDMTQVDINDLLQQIISITDQSLDEAQQR